MMGVALRLWTSRQYSSPGKLDFDLNKIASEAFKTDYNLGTIVQ